MIGLRVWMFKVSGSVLIAVALRPATEPISPALFLALGIFAIVSALELTIMRLKP